MKARLFAIMVLGLAAICLLPAMNGQQPPASPGPGTIQAQIKAARVISQVTVTHAQGISAELHNNDSLVSGDTITTAKESSVVLVFSNGSTVSIGQDSQGFGGRVYARSVRRECETVRAQGGAHTVAHQAEYDLWRTRRQREASQCQVDIPRANAGGRGRHPRHDVPPGLSSVGERPGVFHPQHGKWHGDFPGLIGRAHLDRGEQRGGYQGDN